VNAGEPHLFNGGHTAHIVIHGVNFPGVGQVGHGIQFLGGQGHLRRVDQQIFHTVFLNHGPAAHRVMLFIFHAGGIGIGHLVGGYVLVRGQGNAGIRAHGGVVDDHGGAFDVRHGGGLFFFLQPAGNFPGGSLAHAVGQNVSRGVKQNAAADLVFPIVVMGKPAERGLQTADDNGHIRAECLPGTVGIHDGSPVRAQTGPLAGRIEILTPALFGGGVVGNHGVQIARADHHAQFGPAHGGKGLAAVPIGLGQNGHSESLGFQ